MLIKHITVFLIAILCFNCSYALAAGPWKGKVIDAETKEPIEGAVVLAVWDRNYRTPTGGSSYFYEAKEVLTDKEGRFEIPSYTPINLLPLISYIEGPFFTIFKPGYGSLPMGLWNFFTGAVVESKEIELYGKRYRLATGLIELPPLKTREERRMVGASPMGDKKDWKKQKQFIKLLREEWEYLTGKPAGDLYKIEEDN